MFPLFGILLVAVLVLKFRASSSPLPKANKTLGQGETIPRPMAVPQLSQSLIEGLNQPQAPALAAGFTPKNTGFETPPIMGAGSPFLTF